MTKYTDALNTLMANLKEGYNPKEIQNAYYILKQLEAKYNAVCSKCKEMEVIVTRIKM